MTDADKKILFNAPPGHPKYLVNRFAQACGFIAACFGFAGLAGWSANIPALTTFGQDMIPMAPSTALLFFIFGLAVVLYGFSTHGDSFKIIFKIIVSLCLVAALALFILSSFNITLDFEHLRFGINGDLNGIPLGHMSPLTAGCFSLIGISFLLLLNSSETRLFSISTALAFAYVVLLTAMILTTAYLFGGRVLYNSGVIPPALTTSLAFIFLGAGMMIFPGQMLHQKNNISRKQEKSFNTFLILIFILFSSAIITGGYFSFSNYKNTYQKAIEDQLHIIVDQKVSELVQWRKERLGDASIFYKNQMFSDLVKNYLVSGKDPDTGKLLKAWVENVRSAYDYNNIFLLDTRGKLLLSVPESDKSIDANLEHGTSQIMPVKAVAFLDFNRDATSIHLAVAVPILDVTAGNVPMGILVLGIDPETYLYPLINRWPTTSKTAETLLVRREGNDVVYLNELRFKKDSALNLRFPLTMRDLPAVQAVLGKSGVVEGNDYRGVPVIAGVRAIQGSPWFIVARMDKEEALSPINERMWMLILLVGALLAGVAVAMGLIGRQQRMQVYKERYKAAEAARAAEGRFRETLDRMMEGCQIIGFDWRYLYINDAAAMQGKKSREELLGHTMMEVYPGIENTDMFAALKRCMTDRTELKIENEFLYSGTESGVFSLSIQPVPEGIFILSMDITEQKRAEKREQHLNAILRAIRNVNQLITKEKNRDLLIQRACENLVATRGFKSAWISLIDKSGKPVLTSHASMEGSCFPLQEMFDKTNFPSCAKTALSNPEITVIRTSPDRCPECPAASSCKEDTAFCIRLEKEGSIYGVLQARVPHTFADDDHEQSLFKELAEDIAFALYNLEQEERHKKAEKELRDSEVRYRTLFEAAAEGIVISELETKKLQYANPTFCQMLGYSEDEIKRLKVDDIHTKEVLKQVEMEFDANYLLGKPFKQQGIAFLKKDGTVLLTDVVTTPRISMNGGSYNATFITDVTEKRRADEDKKKLQEQLWQSQKMEAIGRLSGGVAHDFNNMLTTIIGNSEVALMRLRKSHDGDEMKDLIEDIRLAGEKAAILTRQLLAFSRRQILKPEIINLNAIVSEMDKMLRRLIGEDVDLITVLYPDLGAVEVDPGQIEQIILNLAVNARDAMPEGGSLTIETGSVDLDDTYTSSHFPQKPGRYEMISISDTGIGMTKDVQEHIFEPFFTTKPKGKGTGLGLSIVYGIVKQSNGYVWVYSEPGKGATFKIYLPRVEAQPDNQNAGIKKPSAPVGGSETILVVEDDAMIMKMINKVLAKCGYTILCAKDGNEAVSISEQHQDKIDLVLTDVIMPGMGGRELAKRLAVSRPGIKVLYMSGYTDNAVVHHGVLEKGLNFIQKPFPSATLMKKIREVMG